MATATSIEDFEDGSLSEWTNLDPDFTVRTDRPYTGTYSAGITNNNEGSVDVGERVLPDLTGGVQVDEITVYWQETIDSNGGGFRFKNSNGDYECGFTSANPQWVSWFGNFTEFYAGDGYGRWIRTTITFDWSAGEATVSCEDLQSGSTATDTGNLRQGVDIESIVVSNSNGSSWLSNNNFHLWIDDVTTTYPRPEAPPSVSQTIDTPSQITVPWSDPSTSETGFELEKSVDGGAYTSVATTAADTTSYTASVSATADTFQWRVRTLEQDRESLWTETATVSTNGSGLTVSTVSDTELSASWDAKQDVDEYHLYRAQSASSSLGDYTQIATVAAGTTAYDDTGLENGRTYHYRVAPVYGGIEDEPSSDVSATTLINAVRFDSIRSTDADDVELAFSPQDTSSAGSIDIYRSQTQGTLGSQIASLDDDATSYTDTTADVSQVYYYTLRRQTPDTSSDSPQWSTLLPPTGVSVDDTTFDTRAVLSWSDAATTEVGYRIEYSFDGGSTWNEDATLAADTTQYETSDLIPNEQNTGNIEFRVTAFKDQDGDSSGETTAEETAAGSLTAVEREGPYTLALRLNGQLRTLSGGDCRRANITLQPTTQSEWEFETGYDTSLEGWRFSDAFLYGERQDGGFDLICRGECDQVRSRSKGNTTVLRGPDIFVELTTGSQTETYQSIPTHEAIRHYISEHLPDWTANWTVAAPNPSQIADNDLVQSADTDSDWQAITSLSDTDPVAVQNNRLETLQSCWSIEGENYDAGSSAGIGAVSWASNGEYAGFISTGDTATWTFPARDYTIPSDAVDVRFRHNAAPDHHGLDFTLIVNGTEYLLTFLTDGQALPTRDWSPALGTDPYAGQGSGYTGPDINPGDTVQFRIEQTSSAADNVFVDIVAFYDNRYSYFFDNDNGGNSGYLDGPQDYPGMVQVETSTVDRVYNITAADVTSNWTDGDVSGQQEIAVSNTDGASYDITASNTTTVDSAFSTVGTLAKTRFTLSRYGSRTTQTPQTGYKGHAIDSYELRLDGDDLSVLDNLQLSQSHYQNLKQLHERAGYDWSADYREQALAADSFPRRSASDNVDWTVVDSTRDFDVSGYYNAVEVRGRGWTPDSPSPSAYYQDDDAVASNPKGVVEANPVKDTDLTTEADCKSRARELVAEGVAENELTGTLEVYSKAARPGYTDTVSEWGGVSATREKIVFSESRGRATGMVHYQLDPSLVGPVTEVAEGLDSVRDTL